MQEPYPLAPSSRTVSWRNAFRFPHPIRDAINKLNQDGLIGEVTKTGAQLISFDFEYSGS